MTVDELNKIFNSFNGKKVLLVGDSMIDAICGDLSTEFLQKA